MLKVINFIGGLILGALVGAVVVLMLTPQSGQDVQASLQTRLNAIVEEGRRAAADRRAELEAQFAQARQVSKRA
ncbi:MAG: YtxH domain-containing protein [Chloroflexi bacterium]|jgi:gas vesicle protein|nr:YtxH domain-containing protein [Chloroflexota bacterium]